MRKDLLFSLLFVSLFSLTFSLFTPIARVHARARQNNTAKNSSDSYTKCPETPTGTPSSQEPDLKN
jgi:hypothetical protein